MGIFTPGEERNTEYLKVKYSPSTPEKAWYCYLIYFLLLLLLKCFCNAVSLFYGHANKAHCCCCIWISYITAWLTWGAFLTRGPLLTWEAWLTWDACLTTGVQTHDSSNRSNIHDLSDLCTRNVPVKSKLQHPPRATPLLASLFAPLMFAALHNQSPLLIMMLPIYK